MKRAFYGCTSMVYKLDKDAIKSQARGRWLEILPALDSRLAEACERVGRHVPCPLGTGSRDGFRLEASSELDGHAFHNQVDNKMLSDGFGVLSWLNGWTFYESLEAVNNLLDDGVINLPARAAHASPATKNKRTSASAVSGILKDAKKAPNEATKAYLINRGLDAALSLESPSLLHHAGVAIMNDGEKLKDSKGSWVTVPALIGRLSSSNGWLGLSVIRVSKEGWKDDATMIELIKQHTGKAPKSAPSVKQLLKSTDSMNGGAIRLGKAGKTLCVGEGLETMLAVATRLNTLSVAACCTAQLLEAVEVPPQVKRLLIFADKDRSGRGEDAAHRLKSRYSDKLSVEILLPPSPIKEAVSGIDWLDDLNELAALQHLIVG